MVIFYIITCTYYYYNVASKPRTTATVVGVGYILRSALREVWSLANGFYAYFLAPRGIGKTDLKKYGPWAGT